MTTYASVFAASTASALRRHRDRRGHRRAVLRQPAGQRRDEGVAPRAPLHAWRFLLHVPPQRLRLRRRDALYPLLGNPTSRSPAKSPKTSAINRVGQDGLVDQFHVSWDEAFRGVPADFAPYVLTPQGMFPGGSGQCRRLFRQPSARPTYGLFHYSKASPTIRSRSSRKNTP